MRLVVLLVLITLTGIATGSESSMSTTPPRDLDTHHLFTPPASKEAWEARRQEIRRRILVSAGLWPMPPKTPLHPVVTGKFDEPDYTIENVALETRPGFYLCGNLYRPKGKRGPFPAIVNPHGHWEHGRLEMQPDVPRTGPPPAPMGQGRGNLVAIGVNLAKQGYVVFAYDMVGYNDTNQVDHKFANSPRDWLWGVSLNGLQLWNSIRVVDYLEGLPDVDRRRIGVTGASGGGTQTFLLTAVDDRIAASVPVNMVSSYMQGGCLCENGPGLRVGTDNPEISAAFAPRPQLLVAATGDWTTHVPEEERPAIEQVYRLYGAGDRTAASQFNYQHNYNVDSREAMYAWFGRWLLSDPDPSHFREQPFTADVQAMRVWNDRHRMPADALKEPALVESMIHASEAQLDSLWPHDAATLRRFQETYRPAMTTVLDVPAAGRQSSVLSPQSSVVSPRDSGLTTHDSRLTTRSPLVVIALVEGDADAERLLPELKRGPHVTLRLAPVTMSVQDLWQKFYTTYSATPCAERVGEIVEALREAERSQPGRPVNLVGLGRAGLWALLARGVSGVRGHTIVDTAHFRSADDAAYDGWVYAPCLLREGGFRAAALLTAPDPLCLFNTGAEFQTDRIEAGFHALRAPLQLERGTLSGDQIVRRLSRP